MAKDAEMKENSKVCPVLLLLMAIGWVLPVTLFAEELVVKQWRPAEISLAGAKSYPEPFYDVDVLATFTGPGGVIITRPGFWDGGNKWKIRFAPTVAGEWSYTISSNDTSDVGLNGLAGKVKCDPYTGPLEIYKHGFLRVADNKRQLVYRDGTSFFWLADTHWLFGRERLDESNKEGWASQFKGMADKRASQGFTVYQVELFGDWDQSRSAPNLKNYQENFDPKISYLAEKGFVIGTTLGILDSKISQVTVGRGKQEARMAQYVSARYGAYPMSWLTYQECTANNQNGPGWNRSLYMDIVRSVGRAFMNSDAYHHPRTAHSDSPLLTAYRGEDWLDYTMLQAGHGHDVKLNREQYYNYYFDNEKTIPMVQGEANYEFLFDGSMKIDKSRLVTTDDMREMAYLAMQCGSFGYTYGANGVWQATWGGEETGNQTTYGSTPWHVGIDLPGADQLTHLKDFYVSLGWSDLIPRPECDGIISLDSKRSLFERPAVMTDAAVNRVVVYFLRGDPSAGTLSHLQDAPYSARWFDPRRGSYTVIGGCTPKHGAWKFPPKPDAQDWLLILNAKKPVAGGTPVASKWSGVLAARKVERAKNIAPKARVSASSFDHLPGCYSPENATSGDDVSIDNWHHWSNDAGKDPASAANPAWLLLEWNSPEKIRKIVYYTMLGYETQDYTIEYRENGRWKVFGDAVVTGNRDTIREHVVPTPVTADAVRFLGKKGSVSQPTLVRVLQLKVIEP